MQSLIHSAAIFNRWLCKIRTGLEKRGAVNQTKYLMQPVVVPLELVVVMVVHLVLHVLMHLVDAPTTRPRFGLSPDEAIRTASLPHSLECLPRLLHSINPLTYILRIILVLSGWRRQRFGSVRFVVTSHTAQNNIFASSTL